MAHGLSCSTACGIFPDQGSNPSPELAGRFLATAPPGKPLNHVLTTQNMNIIQITKMTKHHPILTNLSDCCFFTLALFLLLCRYDLLRYPVTYLCPFPDSIQSRAKLQFLEPFPKSPNTSRDPQVRSNIFLLRAPWLPTVYVFPQNIEQQTQLQICSWWSLTKSLGESSFSNLEVILLAF